MGLKILGVLGIGIAVFLIAYQYSKRFLDWLRFQSLGTRDYIVDKLAVMFIEADPQKVLLYLVGGSFGLGSIAFLALLPHVVPGFLLGSVLAFLGWKAPKPIIDYMFQSRINKFVLQMVDALSLMSNGLKSGLSVVQSLGLVAQEMPNPIQQEFNLVLSENKLGVSLEEAFLNLAKRVPSEDVEMFVTSINILKETGGNLAETFDTIVQTIRDRIKVENKISALTAQGFYQGMFVMMIIPILAVMLYFSDPEFMNPLFTTVLGWVILTVIVILEVISFFVIKMIIKIDV